ncbi:hypothetical protein M501DRAFT_934594 [Patellaria atrata CBS 101060]|uniref:Peptidase S54 rhomboid domain-containing protein n=1 Tax=Patellaria atrata CBS 101060 TaxID=1346257 RepID=A0A9P4S9W0_9PEZI|nr:hypothetical protein M501DRAFT_934594 [Patellaria atrata CBS 101060]
MPRYRYPFVLLQVPNVLRPILFTLGIGIGSFYLAGFLNRREFQDLSQNAGRPLTSVNEAFAARKLLEQANAQKEVNWLQKHVPLSLVKLYATVKTKWLNTSDGQRAAVLVTGLNLTVFVAWQVPKAGVSLWLAKTFLHHPLSGRSYTLLTSAFSHNAFWHVALNMIALQGFIRATSDYLATKQSTNPVWRADNPDRHIRADPNPIYRTLAFYVTAATVSSLGSHLANALTLMRKASGPTFAAARASLRPSLGASGAVYALATLTALSFPETSVNLFLVVPIPITIGMSGIVALDVAGVLLRWKMFDHFAHLGGAAFGAAYFYGAPRYREWITKRRRGEGVRSR